MELAYIPTPTTALPVFTGMAGAGADGMENYPLRGVNLM